MATIDAIQAWPQSALDRAGAKTEAVRREGEAEVKALQERVAAAQAEIKAKQETRVARIWIGRRRVVHRGCVRLRSGVWC